MENIVLRISPDGRTVTSLYSDRFRLQKLGPISVQRASDVRFNERSQKWEVSVRPTGKLLPKKFESRADAIAYEKEVLPTYISSI
jgi:hypothetical protein